MELLLLSQFNLDSKLPTFFELVVQERLTDTLRDLFRFLHNTLADRVGGVPLTTLPYSTEIFYLGWLVVERMFLKHFDSTFAESCYDMKRTLLQVPKPTVVSSEFPLGIDSSAPPNVGTASEANAATAAAAASMASAVATSSTATEPSPSVGLGSTQDPTKGYAMKPLDNRSRIISLLLSVLLPYLKTKLTAYYTALVETSPDAQLMRETAERNSPVRKYFNQVFVKVWPMIQLLSEGATLLCWVRYMFDVSPFPSPLLAMQGITLRRLDREDYMARQAPTGGGKVLRWGLTALNAVVIFMRFLQWWQTSRNTDQVAGSLTAEQLPVPPPPSATPMSSQFAQGERQAGRPTEVTPGKCPVCRNNVVNSAVCIVSGYVYCYPCLQQEVVQQGRCPVSGLPCSLQNIRRLYET